MTLAREIDTLALKVQADISVDTIDDDLYSSLLSRQVALQIVHRSVLHYPSIPSLEQ